MCVMDSVYLLLRNNRQSGPFTIDELLQQKLLPTDMIWIEGKSTAWSYLSEMELQPFSARADLENTVHPKPVDEIERKAEELRQRILTSSPKYYSPTYSHREEYSTPFILPDDDIQFVDHRKDKNHIGLEALITCLAIGLFAFGVYKGRAFLNDRKDVQSSVATQLVSHDQHTAQKSKPVEVNNPVVEDFTIASGITDSAVFTRPAQKIITKKKTDSSAHTIPQVTIPPVSIAIDEKKPEESPVKTSVQLPEEISIKKDIAAPQSQQDAKTDVQTEEKKKSFLKGIFGKKKKEDDKPVQLKTKENQ
jgi:hypothetical protein